MSGLGFPASDPENRDPRDSRARGSLTAVIVLNFQAQVSSKTEARFVSERNECVSGPSIRRLARENGKGLYFTENPLRCRRAAIGSISCGRGLSPSS